MQKNKMKKNRTMRVAVLMLALTLLTCCFVGSTFARYTSTYSDTDTVTVAKWSFEVEGTDIVTAEDDAITFDLFNTIKDTDGSAETDVIANKIAPGTKGAFDIDLDNTSEVTVNYAVTVALDKTCDFIEWAIEDVDASYGTLAELNNALKGTLAFDNGEGEAETTTTNVKIFWRWVYGDKGVDNAYANIGDIVATVSVEADQAD